MVKICYLDKSAGAIEYISSNSFDIPFNKDIPPSFSIATAGKNNIVTLTHDDEKYIGEYEKIQFSLAHKADENAFTLSVSIKNNSDSPFSPDSADVILGIDTYMEKYPEWNKKFFPTMLRCEKTHLWGYFMNPLGNAAAICTSSPVASYSLDYNVIGKNAYGHRIHTAKLSLLHKGPLPERHPNKECLLPGESIECDISIIPLDDISEIGTSLSQLCDVPVISAPIYTLAPGEKLCFSVECKDAVTTEITDPDGITVTDGRVKKHGLYTVRAKSASGKISEALFFCRKPFSWYLKNARIAAVEKPQKASTHAESWYGLFSGFLAAKHYPDKKLDDIISANCDEIFPLMFDLDVGEPKVIPERIQNMSSAISVLCDRYEADKENGEKYLDTAERIADRLITRQKDDGAYYRNKIVYTCVIYIAKSILELSEAEKQVGRCEKYRKYYDSASRAIEHLVLHLDDLETEGEQTFEDGMISCSALQIAMYALTLSGEKRKKYIDAAEYMDKKHACLEQNLIPDCRMNGGTLRFWEAQYDVMLMSNVVCSPHGWTAWSAYAKYYLYLLTGKEKYIKQLYNIIGSCCQLMSLDGDLRWGFACDPYISAKRFVPDMERPVADGLSCVKLDESAYRGKFVDVTVGEQYIDMISGWYRNGEQKITGGFAGCPLITKDERINVDGQGGCCDNDVHEIFKCLEETVLKKVFVIERDDKSIYAYGAKVEKCDGVITVTPYEEVTHLHTNLTASSVIRIGEITLSASAGTNMYEI